MSWINSEREEAGPDAGRRRVAGKEQGVGLVILAFLQQGEFQSHLRTMFLMNSTRKSKVLPDSERLQVTEEKKINAN